MMHGLANGVFLDDKRFWPIYERAEKLDVPIYLHPATAAARRDATSTTTTTPRTSRWWCAPAWGYTVETATLGDPPGAVRRVREASEAQDHPRPSRRDAAVPGLAHRSRRSRGRAARRSSFRDIFCNNFYITTSGNFSNPALLCCVQEMGVDRILFAVDWPFVVNPPGMEWMKRVPLCDEDKAKILSGNAKRLLRM